jgi:Fe-S-cluster containining protein
MPPKDTIILSIDQALEAICIDFKQYPPQIMLFCEILRVISGGRITTKRDPAKNGIWVTAPGKHQMRWIEGTQLIDYMCDTIHGIDLTPDLIVALCSRVFQSKACLHTSPESDQKHISLETGMENFHCQLCGNCCQTLDYHDQLTAEDVRRWQQMARRDILEWVGIYRKPDHATRYRMWVSPATKEIAKQCPFLKKEKSPTRYLCRIHDVKPAICRQYPVSRKHALMTGCQGFSSLKLKDRR